VNRRNGRPRNQAAFTHFVADSVYPSRYLWRLSLRAESRMGGVVSPRP